MLCLGCLSLEHFYASEAKLFEIFGIITAQNNGFIFPPETNLGTPKARSRVMQEIPGDSVVHIQGYRNDNQAADSGSSGNVTLGIPEKQTLW